MASFPGRTGRRRRVLNEELISASSTHMALRADDRPTADENTHRYCEAAGVEHHPQVTDFVPRRYRSLALLTAGGLASVAVLGALDHWAGAVAEALGRNTTAPFDFAAPGSLAAWMAAVLLLVTSVTCLLVYSIRRHRIDDFRGRYRVWLAAAAVGMALSVNSVAGLHRVLADAVGHLTGWWALRDGAVWWLVLAGLPVAWLLVRALTDVVECRLATSALIAAFAAYVGALVSYLGWNLVTPAPLTEPLVTVGLTLVGHWLALMGVVAYARYVVLDAQGLIVHSRPPVRLVNLDEEISQEEEEETAMSRPTRPQSAAAPRQTEWVDGSQPETDPYDDDGPDRPGRKLSKSERKRLRKLKAQNRAA